MCVCIHTYLHHYIRAYICACSLSHVYVSIYTYALNVSAQICMCQVYTMYVHICIHLYVLVCTHMCAHTCECVLLYVKEHTYVSGGTYLHQ